MNPLARKFFEESICRFVSDEPNAKWEDLPGLPKGWFELSRLSPEDRIEFTRDFWLDQMPYHPSAHPAFFQFFDALDDVAVVAVRPDKSDQFVAELVYSLADNSSFFRGRPGASEMEIEALKLELGIVLPHDYLSFMRIHNGFGKLSEMGMIEIGEISHAKRRVMDLVLQADMTVDPGSLIPFYETLGLASFQCFYLDWYPGSEMGNVYLSGIDYILSDVADKKSWAENLAFPTFSEWLAQYLEGMNLCI
jgi:hypothetical protein